MASSKTSDHASPTSKLNSAISDFAASFIKRELKQLTQECDEKLGRDHVPKVRSLLVEVDKERQAFEDTRKTMLDGLHKKLEALEVDNATIDSVISELQTMYPAYLNAIPSSSALSVPRPSPTRSSSSDSQLSSLGDSIDIVLDHDNSATPIQSEHGKIPNGGYDHGSPKKAGRDPQNTGVSVEHEVQEQLAVETSGTTSSQKRSRDEAFGNEPSKDLTAEAAPKFPTINMVDLAPYESVFQHCGHRGYYVIRCNEDSCKSFRFTEPPLSYRRAVKHFERHHDSNSSEPRQKLTDKEVFLKYAIEVEGVESASRESIDQHIGCRPHTFTPRSRRPSARANRSEPTKKARVEPEDDKNSTPSGRALSSATDNDYDEESEPGLGNPRRHLRRVPRQDYAELVTGKAARAHVAASSDDGRGSSRSASVTEITSTQSTPEPSTYKSTATRIKLTDASKPFGYFGEWPRRSAPR